MSGSSSPVSSSMLNATNFLILNATNCGVPFYGDPAELLTRGSIALYLIGVIYLCVGLRVVSDEYFAPSIEGMIKMWGIPHNVAGATFMAIGASMPELMASIVGTFIAAENATGSGTVIGSVLFNQLLILGCCILVSPGQQMQMTFIEFSRDLFFYGLAIALFVWFFIDGQVTATESWSLCGCYIAYVMMCIVWYKIEPHLFRLVGDPRGNVGEHACSAEPRGANIHEAVDPKIAAADGIVLMPTGPADLEANLAHRQLTKAVNGSIVTDTFSSLESVEHGNEEEIVWRNPYSEAVHVFKNEGWMRKTYFSIEFFWVVIVWATGGWLRHKKWHLTLFMVMLGWLIFQCVYLTYWLEKLSCTIGITPGAMGTILGAAGTSIPNLLCSMYVAKKGQGVMACTEVWGSNVWLIFVCLGLPWGIHSSLTGKPVIVSNSTSLSVWMAAVYVIYILQSVVTRWHYTKVWGYFYCFVYLVFVVFVFSNESLHYVN